VSRAYVSGAAGSRAVVSGADMSGAVVSGAAGSRAVVSGVDMSGAVVSGAGGSRVSSRANKQVSLVWSGEWLQQVWVR
jgi:uncharacterized protein YjbI with pentapeptide repeats